ncbi:hypothetical protein AAFF_G00069570 [Aldrovandia affinis]|uniref:Uncharacterized protein n=1 Tax=Aldrovandia affinis TaxID=143900 RepID=A0AAD7RZ64_9TELE|nr:hypothetical protein AAFF_G00069570 [Aldrovandia affinis]
MTFAQVTDESLASEAGHSQSYAARPANISPAGDDIVTSPYQTRCGHERKGGGSSGPVRGSSPSDCSALSVKGCHTTVPMLLLLHRCPVNEFKAGKTLVKSPPCAQRSTIHRRIRYALS